MSCFGSRGTEREHPPHSTAAYLVVSRVLAFDDTKALSCFNIFDSRTTEARISVPSACLVSRVLTLDDTEMLSLFNLPLNPVMVSGQMDLSFANHLVLHRFDIFHSLDNQIILHSVLPKFTHHAPFVNPPCASGTMVKLFNPDKHCPSNLDRALSHLPSFLPSG